MATATKGPVQEPRHVDAVMLCTMVTADDSPDPCGRPATVFSQGTEGPVALCAAQMDRFRSMKRAVLGSAVSPLPRTLVRRAVNTLLVRGPITTAGRIR